jgi:PmbA protein
MSEAGAELERIAQRAVELSLAAGAGDADAYCEDGTESTVRVYGGVVEDITEAGSRGIGVRTFSGGRSGYAYGSDLSEAGLSQLAAAAVEASAVTEPDEYAGLPDHCAAAEVAGLSSDDFAGWGLDGKADLALSIERAARDRDPAVSNVEDTVYSDGASRLAIANSRGFSASYESTLCYAYAYAFAGEGTDLMTGIGIGTARDPGGLDPEAIGHEAADRALELTGAKQPASRRCPVVFDAFVSASFVGIVGSRLSADAVQRGRSLFAGKEGRSIGSAAFSLFDDATIVEGLATRPFDAEGVPTARTELIRGGNLKTFIFDSYTGRKEGRDSTGNATRGSYRAAPTVGTTNLVMEEGSASLDELIEQAGDGLYVTDVKGLHSGVNPVTGQFSVGATGRLIEGGRLAAPVREFTIASDLITMLEQVKAAGSTSRWVPFGGSVRAVPLLIGEMAVAGS